jgi:hypothetical protein
LIVRKVITHLKVNVWTYNLEVEFEHRRSLSKRFDSLLSTIRKLAGFERFLLGPSLSELTKLAEFGPIVVFDVSEIRSDAFIVDRHNIRSLRLPDLKYNDLKSYSSRFIAALEELTVKTYSTATLEVTTVLEWLWDVAVDPVLNELEFTQMPALGMAWPRVWWVGCGLLNILPIHAAGYHNSPGSRSAIDRVISSYAPRLKHWRILENEERRVMYCTKKPC